MKKRDLMNKKILSVLIVSAFTLCGYGISQNIVSAADAGSYIEQSANMNTDMELYIRSARKSIKANWYPPVSAFENEATITVTLNRKGELQKCVISNSSSDKAFDESIIEAAKKATYKPLPKNFPYDSADLTLSFGMQRRSISK